MLRPTLMNAKFIQFDLPQLYVLSGIVLTTDKTNYLKSFRVRANRKLNHPSTLSEKYKLVRGDQVNMHVSIIPISRPCTCSRRTPTQPPRQGRSKGLSCLLIPTPRHE